MIAINTLRTGSRHDIGEFQTRKDGRKKIDDTLTNETPQDITPRIGNAKARLRRREADWEINGAIKITGMARPVGRLMG